MEAAAAVALARRPYCSLSPWVSVWSLRISGEHPAFERLCTGPTKCHPTDCPNYSNRIIVGVKYCFRYNARNRNIRMTGEDGEPINLENMPQHPRRRRREKKLMTIDEVNEKFPMMKYKSWVASRAQEGLPTRGGISQPPSRAGSLRDADGIIPVTKERESTEERPRSAGASLTKSPTHDDPSTEHAEKTTTSQDVNGQPHSSDGAAAATTGAPDRTASPDSDEDEHYDSDQIHDALPPEALETSGDTCAICIDTLEDDDDVRGLACGHAFHAVCLDPWLTSRRACCPLCKADYYTPKPRPPQPDGAHGGIEMGPPVSIAQDTRTGNMPHRPGVVWVFHPRRGRFALPSFRNGHNASSNNNNNSRMPASPRTPGTPRRQEQQSFLSRMTGPARTSRSTPATNSTETRGNQSGGLLANLRMPRFNLPGRSGQSTATPEVTPSNLEAGTRTQGAR